MSRILSSLSILALMGAGWAVHWGASLFVLACVLAVQVDAIEKRRRMAVTDEVAAKRWVEFLKGPGAWEDLQESERHNYRSAASSVLRLFR